MLLSSTIHINPLNFLKHKRGKMILKKLKLHNIRSYKQDEISFPEGIVLLSGDIGAGKLNLLCLE